MKYILLALCFSGFAARTQAQDSAKTIKAVLDAKQYTFVPLNITTGSGRLRQLTPDYFFKINGDTLKTYLPYFGRAYTAPINPSDAGFNFTTTDFIYTTSKGKRNSYIINVKTKDKVYNTEFTLTIYDNGNAYLRANSSNKQPVSYTGNVKENE
ncbi:MAG: DUF4251 domain-containing protein [Parafilimonas sp.]